MSSSKNKLMSTNLEENSESSDNASNGFMDECNASLFLTVTMNIFSWEIWFRFIEGLTNCLLSIRKMSVMLMIWMFCMQTCQEHLRFYQVKEVRSKQNKHKRCYLIALDME